MAKTDVTPRPGRQAGAPATPAAVRSGTHHVVVLVAAALAILLSATVLASLAALADHSVQAAVQQRLKGDPDTTVEVMGHYRPQDLAAGDRAARGAIERVYGGVPQTTYAALRSPVSLSSEFSAIDSGGAVLNGGSFVVVALPAPQRAAQLVAGSWPKDTGGPAQTALTRAAAARLGLSVGDEFFLQVTTAERAPMRLSGIYQPGTAHPGVLNGLTSSFGTPDGIALVATGAFTADPGIAGDALAVWIGELDPGGLSLGGIGGLRDRVATFSNSDTGLSVFQGRPPTLKDAFATSSMADVLDSLAAPMAVARAGMYIPAALLAALATAALVLTARQLAEARAGQLALMGARGAGAARLLGASAAQWALVAVPAAVAAPFLAGPLLHALHGAGLLHGDLPHSGTTAAGWTAALLAVVVHGLAVLVPTARQAVDRRGGSRLRLRGARAAAFQRAGTDVVLAAIAVLGWLELRQYRTPVAVGGISGTSVDPVLVLTPVVMTAAATLLSLRLLPLAAPLIDRAARRSAGFVLPLGGWQVGRRAARHTGPALLMTLALAVGALSVTALAILDHGAHDQAAFSTGGDLRITPPQVASGQVPPTGQRAAAYAALPGIAAVTPVTDVQMQRGSDALDLAAVNTTAAPDARRGGGSSLPAIRSDLAGGRPAALLGRLRAGVPDQGFPIPGRPTELRLEVGLSASGTGTEDTPLLTVTVEDADGLTSDITVPAAVTGGPARPLAVPLGFTGRSQATRRYPLRITGLGLAFPQPHKRRTYRLTIGSPVVPDGAAWHDLTTTAYNPDGCADDGAGSDKNTAPHLCSSKVRPGMLFSGVVRGPDPDPDAHTWQIGLGPVPSRVVPPLPALADDTLHATGEFETGSVVTVVGNRNTRIRIKVIGRISAVPGFDRSRGRLLVDSRALTAALVAAGGDPPPPDDFWLLSVRHGDTGPAAAALRHDPSLGTATTLAQTQKAIADDPLQRGTRSALLLCLILAPAFAVVGFTLHTAMSARSRRGEFALLRAIGVRRRQLAALLWTEQLGLALLAVVVGTALGTALAVVIMPLVSVDDQGQPVFPHLVAHVPWARVALVAVGTAALIVAVVTALARAFARVDLVRVLRAGDEG
jgi:hypothetical protein